MLREHFPYTATHPELAYLDNAATTQKPAVVCRAMQEYYVEYAANVHRGGYSLGERATDAWESARRTVAEWIGASEREVIFTSGATDGFNLLAQTLTQRCRAGDRIAVTRMEHHSNLLPWRAQAERQGLQVDYIDFDADGLLDAGSLTRAIERRPRIIAFTACSNVLGALTQVETVTAAAKGIGALTVVDACQYVLHHDLDVAALGADFIVFSGHKMLGPTGIGVVYGRQALLDDMTPYRYGGEMVEEVHAETFRLKPAPWRFEAGTPPIGEAIGLAAAIRFLRDQPREALRRHHLELTARCLETLGAYPEVTIYGSRDPAVRTGPIAFNVGAVHPHDVVAILDGHEVALRGGSHCAHVLMQGLGIQSSVRASFAPYNTFEDIERLARGIEEVISIFRVGRE